MSDWIRQEWQQFTPAASTPEIARDGTPAPIDPHMPRRAFWPVDADLEIDRIRTEMPRRCKG